MASLVPGCLSCDIVAGRILQPGGTIYEDEFWNVGSILPPVVWRGFMIIKLKRHCEHLSELTPREAAALGAVIQAASLAVMDVLQPARVFVCSFGDGVRHVHFWVLPRPSHIPSGMHPVIFHLDMRTSLTRWLGIKRWVVPDSEVEQIASQVRERMHQILPAPGPAGY
jgi:diadenosine tetraphosphate (Ap4A) HIT family hydrolase